MFTARRPILRQPAKIIQTSCTAAKNGKLVMSETDLMGVDAVTLNTILVSPVIVLVDETSRHLSFRASPTRMPVLPRT